MIEVRAQIKRWRVTPGFRSFGQGLFHPFRWGLPVELCQVVFQLLVTGLELLSVKRVEFPGL